MSNAFKCTVAFIFGATAGSVVTYKYIKEKYEQIAQEEIESVKEVFSRKEQDYTKEIDEANTRIKANNAKEKPSITEYTSMVEKHNYANYSYKDEIKKDSIKSFEKKTNIPYVISPDEFGTIEDYDQISLTYYSDKVLTDEEDEPVDNVDEIIGLDSLTHFGEYEDDSVFVRNDALQCDYEILLDQRNYTEAISHRPHLTDD